MPLLLEGVVTTWSAWPSTHPSEALVQLVTDTHLARRAQHGHAKFPGDREWVMPFKCCFLSGKVCVHFPVLPCHY